MSGNTGSLVGEKCDLSPSTSPLALAWPWCTGKWSGLRHLATPPLVPVHHTALDPGFLVLLAQVGRTAWRGVSALGDPEQASLPTLPVWNVCKVSRIVRGP